MLDALATLTDALRPAAGPGVAFPLRLRRAWQRDLESLGLQYEDVEGRVVPAQWWSDRERTAAEHGRIARGGGDALLARAGEELVLLQPHGADRKLPALDRLLGEPGAELLTHRPGRRAVVRLRSPHGTLFAKALRPSKVDRVLKSHALVAALSGRAFEIPPLRSSDTTGGLIVMGELPGTSLHDLASVDEGAFVEGCGRAGHALRSLHADAPDWLPAHDRRAEVEMLRERVAGVAAFVPAWHGAVASCCDRVSEQLAGVEDKPVVLHRDFYDKQVIVGAAGEVGLLDFDTLGAGEAALDLANMLAHLELRVLQGACHRETASRAAAAFLDAYGPGDSVGARIPAYLDAARLRLAMLYAFWPEWARLTPRLLEAIGGPAGLGRVVARVKAASATRGSGGRPVSGDAGCPLVFVLGCPRSGTTMLERMLDAHRDLAMTHETHWITKHSKRRRDLTPEGFLRPDTLDALYADYRFTRMAPPREHIEAAMARRPLKYRRFVRMVFEHYCRSRGKPFAGDKSTGGYLRDITGLRRVCPDSKIIHLVRDGRDVCLSMLDWPKAPRAAGRFAMFRDDPVATTASWWRWHVLSGRGQGRPLGSDIYRELRYEELVREPERRCAELCGFLGLDPDPSMARFHAGRSRPDGGRSANAAWIAPTPGLRDWRSQLPDEHIELFEAVAGDALDAFGYERRFHRVSARLAEIAAERVARWEQEVGGGASASREVIVTAANHLSEGESR